VGLFFSLNNLNPVSINFYYTRVDIPLALVLMLEFTVGIALGLLVGFSRKLKNKSDYQRLNNQLISVEQELESLRTSIPNHQTE